MLQIIQLFVNYIGLQILILWKNVPPKFTICMARCAKKLNFNILYCLKGYKKTTWNIIDNEMKCILLLGKINYANLKESNQQKRLCVQL